MSISILGSDFERKEQDYIQTKIPMETEKARSMKNKMVLAIIYYTPTYELVSEKHLRGKIIEYELYDPDTKVRIK